jgi:hypothetical protein
MQSLMKRENEADTNDGKTILILSAITLGVVKVMVQAVSRRPLAAKAWVQALVSPCRICGGQSGNGTLSSEFFGFTLLISFHRGSSYSNITGWMNNRPADSSSSET